ncbi:polysaccharide pyruvyl transferase family protein [bacterium]|nr:polysaccharide pyruvyl transferase family protein [bacterium]
MRKALQKMTDLHNILLLNDNSAHLNWGAQATPPSLIKVLKQSIPECCIKTLSHEWLARGYQYRLNRVFGSKLIREVDFWRCFRPVLYRVSKRESFYPDVIDDFDYWADQWLSDNCGLHASEFLNLAGKADVIIYNGENSLYRNTPEGCHGIFLLWLAKTRLSKPACIVNHTAHLNDVKPILSSMVKEVYPRLDLVAVREACSFETLKSLRIDNVEVYPDVAFSQIPNEYPDQRVESWLERNGLENQSYFCLSASGLPVSMPRGNYDGEISHLVHQLKSSGLQAVLVAKDPWCLPLKDVAHRTNSIFFGPEHEFHDLWSLFRKASFLVTGHYHYAIFATMVGCPFVPLTVNNHKMKGYCKLLDWHRLEPFDATHIAHCCNDIVLEAGKLQKNRSKYSEYLIQKTAVFRYEISRLGSGIRTLITNNEPTE